MSSPVTTDLTRVLYRQGDASQNKTESSKYLEKIYSKSSDQIKAIPYEKLMKKIGKEFGVDVLKKTNQFLFNADEKQFKGMKEFKDRILNSFATNSPIDGSDIKYTVEIARRIFEGSLAVNS
jgi:hypothetical protein